MSAIEHLTKRRDFLSVANKGRSIVTSTMVVQWLEGQISTEKGSSFRIGYTSSRRVGNAVVRNRSRRRLKAITHIHFKTHSFPPGDMVIIARSSTPTANFSKLSADFTQALEKLGA